MILNNKAFFHIVLSHDLVFLLKAIREQFERLNLFLIHTAHTTQPNMNNLFWPDENRLEQCFAANIVQCCQQYWTSCWAGTSLQSAVTMLNNIVDNLEQCGKQNIVQCCFHQARTGCAFYAVYTAKNEQPVLAWWKQHWTMFCCQHCSMLSTIGNRVLRPELACNQV